MHEPLLELEKQLDELLGKDSPYKLPKNGKKEFAAALWWICLLIGIIQLWGAWSLWQIGHSFSAIQTPSFLGNTLTYTQILPHLNFTYYLAFFSILAEAALVLLAVPALKDYRKHGWDLIYYALLLNVVYAFIRIFSATGGGVGQFVVQFFATAIAAYFVFQVREFFNKPDAKPSKS